MAVHQFDPKRLSHQRHCLHGEQTDGERQVPPAHSVPVQGRELNVPVELGRKVKDVGVVKDEELKLEEIQASHTRLEP